jgi:hypothetical protein
MIFTEGKKYRVIKPCPQCSVPCPFTIGSVFTVSTVFTESVVFKEYYAAYPLQSALQIFEEVDEGEDSVDQPSDPAARYGYISVVLPCTCDLVTQLLPYGCRCGGK